MGTPPWTRCRRIVVDRTAHLVGDHARDLGAALDDLAARSEARRIHRHHGPHRQRRCDETTAVPDAPAPPGGGRGGRRRTDCSDRALTAAATRPGPPDRGPAVATGGHPPEDAPPRAGGAVFRRPAAGSLRPAHPRVPPTPPPQPGRCRGLSRGSNGCRAVHHRSVPGGGQREEQQQVDRGKHAPDPTATTTQGVERRTAPCAPTRGRQSTMQIAEQQPRDQQAHGRGPASPGRGSDEPEKPKEPCRPAPHTRSNRNRLRGTSPSRGRAPRPIEHPRRGSLGEPVGQHTDASAPSATAATAAPNDGEIRSAPRNDARIRYHDRENRNDAHANGATARGGTTTSCVAVYGCRGSPTAQ